MYWLLVLALCLTFACPQTKRRPPYACQCLMDANERQNCDSTSAGITAEECTAKGCCFDSTVPDVPWCFKPSGERVSLRYAKKMIAPESRIKCGYEGISRKRCKRIGCCFDPTASSALMCFYPPVNNVSQHCLMDMSAREECGYPSITAEECQEKGCCFNSYVISTRWCFRPLSNKVGEEPRVIKPCVNKKKCFPNGLPWRNNRTTTMSCDKSQPKMLLFSCHARTCGMAPKKRVPCGYPGISADECLDKGCCYEHYQYAPKVPWCFEPLEMQGNFSV